MIPRDPDIRPVKVLFMIGVAVLLALIILFGAMFVLRPAAAQTVVVSAALPEVRYGGRIICVRLARASIDLKERSALFGMMRTWTTLAKFVAEYGKAQQAVETC